MFLSNKPGVPPGINLLQKPSQKLRRPRGNLANPVIFSRKPGEDEYSTGSVTEGCFRCCREVTNASAKMAFDGSIEQCPSLVSQPFLNMISFLYSGPPGYSKWTSFAHRTTLQNVPNIAKCILMSDPWSRVGVFGQTGPISFEQPDLRGTDTFVYRRKCCVLATLLVWGTSNTISPSRFPLLLYIHHCENDFGTKVTSEVGVTWCFDRAIQIPFLRAKWLNFEGL